MTATITWTKLRSGAWGIKGAADAITEGATVTVTRKDGTEKAATVAKVVWTDGQAAIAAVADDAQGAKKNGARKGRCDECGEFRRLVVEAYDSSGLAGFVCSTCARMSEFERSFG